MKYGIILSIVFVAILITALIVFSTKPLSPYEELGTWGSLKRLFSGPEREPEYNKLAGELIQKYLKEEFQPSEINLTLGVSPYLEEKGKTFYGFIWKTNKEKFYARIEYNKDKKTVSHFHLLIHSILDSEDKSTDYYLKVPKTDWDCWEQMSMDYCKAIWFDGEDRIELATNSWGIKTNSIVLCKMYKESERYDVGCVN